ncbi:MAG TPA: hypothetical protein PK082_00465 [Phycisphaerae bacterium]|nr:hypothetical protein [Phycisphaerae bacterium]
MRTILILGVLCAVCGGLLPGCGNVTLRGEALTAAETSAMDAYQAVQRAGATTTTQPTWEQSYLVENFRQWRYFVRAARKDLTWGPKLAGE